MHAGCFIVSAGNHIMYDDFAISRILGKTNHGKKRKVEEFSVILEEKVEITAEERDTT